MKKTTQSQVVVTATRLLTAVLLVFLFAGCSSFKTGKTDSGLDASADEWTLEAYHQFLDDNRKHLNHIYSDDYEEYLFLVDTGEGARPVQDLINAESVRWLWTGLGLETLTEQEKVQLCHTFIINRFTYAAIPNQWPFPEETLRNRKGDCKGLSLLLISLLLSLDLECYGAIGHGHMWVNVRVNGTWRTLETDTDPERNTIYQAPGFYTAPLFKIFQHQTVKRVRKKQGSRRDRA